MIALFEHLLLLFPLVLGAYIVFSLLKIPDLSIESAFVFGAACAYQAEALPLPFVILSAIGGGGLVGLMTGSLNQYFGIPLLLSAVIINGFFHGAVQLTLGNSIAGYEHAASPFLIFHTEWIFLLGAALILSAVFILLFRSELGFSLAIYGNNPRFLHSHLISHRYVLLCGTVISGGLAGLSGYFFSRSNGFVDLTMGNGIVLLCLTALILGKMIIKRPSPTLKVPLLSAALYLLLQHVLIQAGIDLKYFQSFQAFLVFLCLVLLMKKQQETIDHLGV